MMSNSFSPSARRSRWLAPLLELRALLGHQLADLLAAGLAQVVGLGERVAGELLRDPHHALLVDHQAVRVAEDLLGVGVEVLDRLAAVLAVGVVVVHVRRHRAGPVERDERGDVLEAVGASERMSARIGGDSSWNTPIVSPRAQSSS
jgi:hypothetical protein